MPGIQFPIYSDPHCCVVLQSFGAVHLWRHTNLNPSHQAEVILPTMNHFVIPELMWRHLCDAPLLFLIYFQMQERISQMEQREGRSQVEVANQVLQPIQELTSPGN